MNTSRFNKTTSQPATATTTVSLGSLLLGFLKIGSIGFGGGMAVIALMEKEFVRNRQIIPAEEFVHSMGLGQALGAFAVNVSVFIGYRLFGVIGALLSAGVFLAPSVGIVILLSELYFRFHAIPALRGTVEGLAPVVIALILNAAWSIGRKVLRSWPTILIALAAFVAGVSHLNALWVLFGSGAAGFLLPTRKRPPNQSQQPAKVIEQDSSRLTSIALLVATPLFVIAAEFFRIGMMFVGGGFVLVPVLHDRLVSQLRWLRPQEFLDGLAISNLSPGPVAVVATFTGYHLAGVAGALMATVALFWSGPHF